MILPEQIIIYGSVLITVSFALLLIAVVVTHLALLRKYRTLLEEKAKLKAAAEVEVDKILEEARQKSHQIVEESQQKAAKVVSDAGVFSNELKNKMIVQLDKVSKDYAKDYQGTIEAAKNEAVKVISGISNELKGEASREIAAMRLVLEQEVAKTHLETKKAIDAAYKRVEEEIKAYREAKIKRVDEEIYEIVRQVTQDILGKAIDTRQHEELVVKALEEAKRQNIF